MNIDAIIKGFSALNKILKIKTIASGIIGAGMLVTGAYYATQQFRSRDGREFQIDAPTYQEVSKVNLDVKSRTIDSNGKATSGESFKVGVKANLDLENKTIYLGIYTPNFDRKPRTTEEERIPAYARHNVINHQFSNLFLFYPEQIDISGIEEQAYSVPEYSWFSDLKNPNEEANAKIVRSGSEKIVNALEAAVPIPFSSEICNRFIDYSQDKCKDQLQEIAKRLGDGNLTILRVPFFAQETLGTNITAYEIKIPFNIEGKDKRTIYIWGKIATGDPTIPSDNNATNKFGELENISLKIVVDPERKTWNKKTLEWFLLQDEEQLGESTGRYFEGESLVELNNMFTKHDLPEVKRGAKTGYILELNQRKVGFEQLVLEYGSTEDTHKSTGNIDSWLGVRGQAFFKDKWLIIFTRTGNRKPDKTEEEFSEKIINSLLKFRARTEVNTLLGIYPRTSEDEQDLRFCVKDMLGLPEPYGKVLTEISQQRTKKTEEIRERLRQKSN